MERHLTLKDPLLIRIADLADREGVVAYVVGGYVRDALRSSPVKDMDIVVVGDGIAFAERVAADLGAGPVVKFERFGTAMIHHGDQKLEFVGARRESYDRDSRKPAVNRGTIEEDLSRRDFTVNAIAVSLNRESRGTLLDPYAGRNDLKRRLLRTPLDPRATFDDDPLRIMRAFRFAAQLGFEVVPEVLEAAAAMKDRLLIVSQERISEEFLKLLSSPKPSVGLELMQQTGVMAIVFPEVAELQGVDQRREHHHKDVFFHTLKVLDNLSERSANVWLRMAALLHDIAKPKTKAFKEGIGWTFHGHEELGARMVKTIFRRMKFPLQHVPYVEKLVRLHLRPMALVDDGVTDSAVRRLMFEAGEEIDDLMALCRADITSRNPRLVTQVRRNYDAVVRKMEEVEEKDRIRQWQPPVRGEIMQICNLPPGPAVGRLKQAITDAILDGRIPNTHEAALSYLKEVKDEILNQPDGPRAGSPARP
jgi:putative nucleotidyltransferase with HDIG domain